ncbi:MAG: RluA family pseudouridine synthase [Candidatus Kapaibacteriota bacterium]
MNSQQSSNPNYPEKVEHVYTFQITKGQQPERVDAFITRSIEHATRNRVQKAIDRGAVLVNGEVTKANYKIRPGDHLTVTVMKPPPLQLVPEDLPLEVLYEDQDLLVVNKAAGMPVHPGIGNRVGTLVNAVLWHTGQRQAIDVLQRRESWEDTDDTDETAYADDGVLRPGIVHRLDKDTSGVMVVGKSYAVTMALAEQFAQRTVSREYVALAWGVVRDDRRLIEASIGRSTRDRTLMQVVDRGGKYAATEVTVVERYDAATLVTCNLRTGRTHQIRVHLASVRHPIVGDPGYGGREAAVLAIHHLYRLQAKAALQVIHRQALHARSLGFTHPRTGERMEFSAPVPADMVEAILALRPTGVGPLPPCVTGSQPLDASHKAMDDRRGSDVDSE